MGSPCTSCSNPCCPVMWVGQPLCPFTVLSKILLALFPTTPKFLSGLHANAKAALVSKILVLTHGNQRLIVAPHHILVELLLPLRQVSPFLLREMDGDVIKRDRDLKPHNKVSLDHEAGSHRWPVPMTHPRPSGPRGKSPHPQLWGFTRTSLEVRPRSWPQRVEELSCLVLCLSQDSSCCSEA